MDDATRHALRSLNEHFYEERGVAFSRTRDHAWPGWERLTPHLERMASTHSPLRVLDVGCGNGRFARFLAEHFQGSERRIAYTGVDASRTLLDVARQQEAPGVETHYRQGDFVEDPSVLSHGAYHAVVLFGVLHEVPGRAARRALIERLTERVARGGLLVLARWLFASRPRTRDRILDWERWNASATPPIDLAQLEPGDALLPWQTPAEEARRAPAKTDVRYVHAIDDLEMGALTRDLPVLRVDQFQDDGRERNLNEYSVYRRT
jgi:2-polyprenyl-3-methyl-5-hydroxy-6-metoxy-1,4-benzoquinol methylase